MVTIEYNKANKYSILVKENQNHHTFEWLGSLSIFTDENGEAFLDISFTAQEPFQDTQYQPRNRNSTFLSIDCIET
jgi:hypothetical protein